MSVGRRPAGPRGPEAWLPRFHVTAQRNWINDPNGPIQHEGVYHLFYQANPDAPFWARPLWGHVTSTDLVRWTRRPPALVPEPGGPDADGCWSGCTRLVNGRAAIYYTGVVGEGEARVESVCRAWASADLLAWERDPANPLVPGAPSRLGSGYHRDPFLWQDRDGWHMLLGSGTCAGERHGQVLRYDSADATEWTYGGVFFSAPRAVGSVDLGAHWECPQLLLDGDTAALVLSCAAPGDRPLTDAVVFTGALRDGAFEGELDGRLDHGDVLYAPALLRDESGRALLWGWAQERLDADRQARLPRAGALSLPRELRFAGGRLRTSPIAELRRLRRGALNTDGRVAGRPLPAQCELSADFAGQGRGGWTLTDREGGAGLSLDVDLDRHIMHVAVADAVTAPRALAAPLEPLAAHTMRVFVDGSLIEACADGERFVTTRAHPATGSWWAAELRAGPDARAGAVEAWALTDAAIDGH